jgi:hypothetical protein
MANHIVQKISQVTDAEGRTQTEQVTIFKKVSSEPDFVKMYLQHAAYLRHLRGRERDVLGELLIRMDYNNNVSLPAGVREDICRSLGMYKKDSGGNCGIWAKATDDNGNKLLSVSSLNVSLAGLCKKNVIARSGRGVYTVNPELFGKGRWQDIQQIRSVTKIQFGSVEQKRLGNG